MPQISYLVLTQAIARLADPSTGFNPALVAACASQAPAATPFVIDWSDTSANFWRAQVSADDLDETSAAAGTLCMAYVLRAATPGDSYQKFSIFGGPVEIGVDFDIMWLEDDAPHNTEGLANATADAMVQTFNASQFFGSFSVGVLWNGNVDIQLGPLRQAGEAWRQRITCRLAFDLQS